MKPKNYREHNLNIVRTLESTIGLNIYKTPALRDVIDHVSHHVMHDVTHSQNQVTDHVTDDVTHS